VYSSRTVKRDELKKHFKSVKLFRPKSVQQSSKEFFM